MPKGFKIKDNSVPILWLAALVPLLIPLIGKLFEVSINLDTVALSYLLTSVFVMIEIGVMGLIRSKKLADDPLRTVGAIVALAGLVVAVMMFTGFAVYSWLLVGIGSLLAIYGFVEAFR